MDFATRFTTPSEGGLTPGVCLLVWTPRIGSLSRDVWVFETLFLLAGADEVYAFLGSLAAIIEPVEVKFLWRPQLRYPDDEMVLEAAVNGAADHRVTYNVADFGPAYRFGLTGATPQEYLMEIAR